MQPRTRSRAASEKAARPRPPAPRPYHHGNLRAVLLEAAESLLEQRGVQSLTLREVARAAGVSHSAPYHHFASLDDLLAVIAQRGFEALGAAVARATDVADTRERLLRVTQAYVQCAVAHPQRFRLMFGPMLATKSTRPALKQAAEEAFGHVLRAALAHDPKRGADLAAAGWSLAHGLSHLIIDGALEGMPFERLQPQTLARRLGERLLG